MSGVYRDHRLHVMSAKCSSCIFRSPRDGQIQGLQPGRIAGMVRDCQHDAGNISCHQSLYDDRVQPAICRGFWDLPKAPTSLLRLAENMGIVVYDDPPK